MHTYDYIFQALLAVIGGAVTVNAVILNLTTNMNLGNILQLILGVFLLGYCIFYKKIKEHIPTFIKVVIWSIVLMFILSATALIFHGMSDTVTYDEDVIIILGAGISGTKPGKALKSRLDAAVEYYNKNPDVIFVVSGGQGPQEDISEADAMSRYLIENGVMPKSIAVEDSSTSTRENFEFSKKVIEGFAGKDCKVGYITNEFHIYRAGRYAKQAGFENASHLHGKSRIGGLLSSGLREELAILKLWIIGR